MPWTKEALRVKNKRKKTEKDKGNKQLSLDESADVDVNKNPSEISRIGDGSLFYRHDDPFNVCNEGGISIDIDDETGKVTPA